MGVFAGPEIVENGLVLALDAGNSKSYPGSGTTWTDLSGRGNNGTLTNGPTYSSSNGGSIVFDGTNDYINLSTTPIPLTSNFTIFVFWKTTNNNTYQHIIQSYPGIDNGRFTHNINSGSVQTFLGQSTGGNILIDKPISSNTYYMSTVLRNSNTLSMYVNTEFIGSGNMTTNIVSAQQAIGNAPTDPFFSSRNFIGNIASAQLYNRALTESEIQQNYNATKSRFGL